MHQLLQQLELDQLLLHRKDEPLSAGEELLCHRSYRDIQELVQP